MKTRLLPATALVVLAALSPGFAAAKCAWQTHQKTVSTCAAGQTWDATTQTCIIPVQS